MAGVQRRGDPNILGGVAMGGEPSVRVNGRPVLVNNIGVSPHFPCKPGLSLAALHCFCLTKGGKSSVRAGGVPIVCNYASDWCGHPRLSGSTNVRIG